MLMKTISFITLITLLVTSCSLEPSKDVQIDVPKKHYSKELDHHFKKENNLRELTEKIQQTDRFKSCHVQIAIEDETVLIVGQAPTEELKQIVNATVSEKLPNYKIINRLTIAKRNPPTLQLLDTWISTKLRTNLIFKRNIRDRKIQILTENKQVFLMGHVNKEEANLAINIAKGIDGVTKVITLFEIDKTNHA